MWVWSVSCSVSSDCVGASVWRQGASAQYFGRNKVEYVDFDFRILSTEHFAVYYYPREEQAARLAARLAERWYSRFSRLSKHELDRRQPLVLYASQSEFAQTNVVAGILPDTVGGVTESARRRIAMPFAPTCAETNRVLGHEIVHAFQYDIARRHGGGLGQPLWFVEGMAEYLARGAIDDRISLVASRCGVERPRAATPARCRPSPLPVSIRACVLGISGAAIRRRRRGKGLKPGKSKRKSTDRMRVATGNELDASSTTGARRSCARTAKSAKRRPDPGLNRLANSAFGSTQLAPAISPDGRYRRCFFPSAIALRSICSSRMSKPAASCESSPVPQRARASIACSRCDRPAHGAQTGSGSRLPPSVRPGRARRARHAATRGRARNPAARFGPDSVTHLVA